VKARILSCAEREFAEAVDFYNAERPGLGDELVSGGSTAHAGPDFRVSGSMASLL
jgi:hypothetical protein